MHLVSLNHLSHAMTVCHLSCLFSSIFIFLLMSSTLSFMASLSWARLCRTPDPDPRSVDIVQVVMSTYFSTSTDQIVVLDVEF